MICGLLGFGDWDSGGFRDFGAVSFHGRIGCCVWDFHCASFRFQGREYTDAGLRLLEVLQVKSHCSSCSDLRKERCLKGDRWQRSPPALAQMCQWILNAGPETGGARKQLFGFPNKFQLFPLGLNAAGVAKKAAGVDRQACPKPDMGLGLSV